MIKVREAVIDDVYYLGSRLRQQDVDEVRASHGLTGEEAVLLSYNLSTITYVAEMDNRVICMFGVSKSKNGGYPWLLGTDDVKNIPVSFFRISRKYIEEWLRAFGFLENYVDSRNLLSIQWLKWLGFTIEQAHPFGIEQRLFHRFKKEG